MPIQRITSFKANTAADVTILLEAYKLLEAENLKDGEPYILSAQAYALHDDPRRQGYNITAITQFKDLEDMKFYDEECPAHKKLKQGLAGKIQPPPLQLIMEIP